jgi:uncharacterized short protein YbdD (DUF466 family)
MLSKICLTHKLNNFVSILRRLSGDDAYERYLIHCQNHHPTDPQLSREAFFKAELERKWNRINRCC